MERAQNDQNDQFFLPFCVNCSQVAMFQIMAALCPHGQGEGGGGVPKIPKFVRTSFMDDSYVNYCNRRNSDYTLYRLNLVQASK